MRGGLLVPMLTGVLLLAACMKNPPAPSKMSPPAAAEAGSTAQQKVGALLRAGRFEPALAAIREERRNKNSSRLLEDEYLQVLQALAAAGDKHFRGGDYRQAGKTFRTLLDHFPRGQAIAPRLLVNRETVEKLLQSCADRLMDGGLTEYRAGKLQQAIEIWKGILLFSPAHDGAKKAIHTADIQLKNLRSLP